MHASGLLRSSALGAFSAIAVVAALPLLAACSGGAPGEPARSNVEETSPTSPVEPVEQESPKPGPVTVSPACGVPGSVVVLRLGLTHEGKVPSCLRVDDFEVRFGAGRPARVYQVGPTSDGYCALDVYVPADVQSTKISVTSGREVFESDAVFGVPCP